MKTETPRELAERIVKVSAEKDRDNNIVGGMLFVCGQRVGRSRPYERVAEQCRHLRFEIEQMIAERDKANGGGRCP